MPRILVADDNQIVLKQLTAVISQQTGWIVCGEAADGRQAVELANAVKPDLVMLDWSMPVLNGLDAAKEILKTAPSVPVVLFTLHKSTQLEEEAMKFGVRKVISKMDGFMALFAGLEEALGEGRVPADAPAHSATPAPIGPLDVTKELSLDVPAPATEGSAAAPQIQSNGKKPPQEPEAQLDRN